MANIDYAYKSQILKTDLCKSINSIDKRDYINSLDGVLVDYDLGAEYFDLLLKYGIRDIEEARKINKASFYRIRRLRKRVGEMLKKGNCIFCTFNFRDEVLKATSPDTRRKYVRRYLSSFNCDYVANIDFGSDKEYTDRKGNKRKGTAREHYHALVCIDSLPSTGWTYGFQWLENVRLKSSTDRKLSKYIAKLTNHAIKETTKRSCLIYSRSQA